MILEKSFVVAVIMSVKNKYFQERFVTYKEVNMICYKLQERFNLEKVNGCISGYIDKNFFDLHDVILLNRKNDVSIKDIEERYQGYCYDKKVFDILWDFEYILELILEINKNELENCLVEQKKKKLVKLN